MQISCFKEHSSQDIPVFLDRKFGKWCFFLVGWFAISWLTFCWVELHACFLKFYFDACILLGAALFYISFEFADVIYLMEISSWKTHANTDNFSLFFFLFITQLCRSYISPSLFSPSPFPNAVYTTWHGTASSRSSRSNSSSNCWFCWWSRERWLETYGH